MARPYSRATRTIAALVFSPSNHLILTVVGMGLAVFAGQRLPRRDAGSGDGDGTNDPGPPRRSARDAEG